MAEEWAAIRRDGVIESDIAKTCSVKEFPFSIMIPSPPFVFGECGALVTYTKNPEKRALLIAAAPQMFEALLDVEWSGVCDDEEGGEAACCPWCGGDKRDGHQDVCKLADALAKAKGRPT